MSGKYPRIERVNKRHRNTCARCKCGKLAKFKSEIQLNYMRGDDLVFWACDAHKKDFEFLMAE